MESMVLHTSKCIIQPQGQVDIHKVPQGQK